MTKRKGEAGENCWSLPKDSEQGRRFAGRANQKWRNNKEHKNGGQRRSYQWKQKPEKAQRKKWSNGRTIGGCSLQCVAQEKDWNNAAKKKAKTVAPLEISPLNLMISMNLLGSGSYGCCYLTSYRGMEVVSKNFIVKASRGETPGQAKDRVRQELIYEPAYLGISVIILAFHYCLEFVVNGHLSTSLCSSMGTGETTNLWQYITHYPMERSLTELPGLT